MTKIKF